MSKDNAAIAAWALRKKQIKLEKREREKALQEKFDSAGYPPLDFDPVPEPAPAPEPEPCGLIESLARDFQAIGFTVIPIGEILQEAQPPAPKVAIKGLAFDAKRGMYRARAYHKNKQVSLYWGPVLSKAIEALEEWRATGRTPNDM